MVPDEEALDVLKLYSHRGQLSRVVCLGNAGGFSGSRLWRCEFNDDAMCLRRWPVEHPTEDRLILIHRVLLHLAQARIDFVPVPVLTNSGLSFVRRRGHFWELTKWLPGNADFHARPSIQRLEAALTALAQIHSASGTLADLHSIGPIPAVIDRCRRLRELTPYRVDELRGAVGKEWGRELADLVRQTLDIAASQVAVCRSQLFRFERTSTDLFPCLRDIWHDHVLYVESKVTGMIDFGAMRIDSPAGDLARLIGSLAADDQLMRKVAFQAYGQIRPIPDIEQAMIEVFDLANLVLSGMNWAQWLYVDKRTFEDWGRVMIRIQEIHSRLTTRAV
jgi:homoserine kinase type II